MFDSAVRTARTEQRLRAEIHPPTAPYNDLTTQHEALAERMTQVFQRGDTISPQVSCAGHCVFIQAQNTRYCVTISNDHLLLASSADDTTLGRFSSPAGVCRHIASLARR